MKKYQTKSHPQANNAWPVLCFSETILKHVFTNIWQPESVQLFIDEICWIKANKTSEILCFTWQCATCLTNKSHVNLLHWPQKWVRRECWERESKTWLLLGEALISLKAFISSDLFTPSLAEAACSELGRIFVHLILILVNSYFIKMTPSRRRTLTVKWWTLHDRLIQSVKEEIDCWEVIQINQTK